MASTEFEALDPVINALGTINVEHLTEKHRLCFGVWHYKPRHSYLIRLHMTQTGVVAESTSLKNGSAQLTERMRLIQQESGIIAAMNDAFEWLEEQTKPKAVPA